MLELDLPSVIIACLTVIIQTAWRPAVETAVVANKAFDGIVVRPGMVYGRSGSLIALLFDQATKAAQKNEGTFSWPATPGKRWGLIHQDDLAELFVRVGEAVSHCSNA